MNSRLAGKRAVVTGAAQGIGRTIAQMFAAQGADVLSCDINAALDADGFAADLTQEEGAAALAQATRARWGAVDILVNAAATLRFAPLADTTLADWRTTTAARLTQGFL